MTYDKATGEVTIHDTNENVKPKKIISSMDEVL
jgi:hypothetical protein